MNYFKKFKYLIPLLIFNFLGLSTQISWSALGGPASSVETDSKTFATMKHSAVKSNNYTVHELTYDAGIIKEYVSSDNVVFAVSWQGISYPDLSQLLGTYLNEYRTTSQQKRRIKGNRHSSQVVSGDLIVEKWGHMRNHQGRAYVPSLLPSGVTADAIK